MSLSDWQEDIAKLRSMVSGIVTASYDNDYNLYRWVKAWKGDVNAIYPLFAEHMKLRQALKMDTEDFGIYKPGCQEGKVELALKSAIGIPELSSDRVDRDGNLLSVMKLGRINIRELQDTVKSSDYLLFNLKVAEMVRRKLQSVEEKGGLPIGLTVIYDLDGIVLSKAVIDAIQGGTGNGLKMVQAHFPELTKRLIVVNVPPAVDYLWNAIKIFLAERTRKKVMFLGAEWRSQILNYIDAEHLPAEYGGTSPMIYDDPQSMSALGSIYILPEVVALNTVHIKPRESFTAETVVTHSEIYLEWSFRANGEVTFGIEEKQENSSAVSSWKPVLPLLPLNSKFHLEFGTLTCSGPGTYRFIIRNDAAYLFSTKFDYWIIVQHPDGSKYPQEVAKLNSPSSPTAT